MKSSDFSPDILEFMYLLHEFGVRYLIVGGEAVIYYGHARLTGDVDFFMSVKKRTPETCIRPFTRSGTAPYRAT